MALMYQKLIVSIFKTASIAYKYDQHMRTVGDIIFKIVHVATSKIDTANTNKGNGDSIADAFENEHEQKKRSSGGKWNIAVLVTGVNAWMPRNAHA